MGVCKLAGLWNLSVFTQHIKNTNVCCIYTCNIHAYNISSKMLIWYLVALPVYVYSHVQQISTFSWAFSFHNSPRPGSATAYRKVLPLGKASPGEGFGWMWKWGRVVGMHLFYQKFRRYLETWAFLDSHWFADDFWWWQHWCCAKKKIHNGFCGLETC